MCSNIVLLFLSAKFAQPIPGRSRASANCHQPQLAYHRTTRHADSRTKAPMALALYESFRQWARLLHPLCGVHGMLSCCIVCGNLAGAVGCETPWVAFTVARY
jgi:hypothetical protein